VNTEPDKIPCLDCICFAICKGQDMSPLLYKCSILKKYMEINFYHFDVGHAIIDGMTLPRKEDY
jgi:hypothetical protein